jgi:hypothetical protein
MIRSVLASPQGRQIKPRNTPASWVRKAWSVINASVTLSRRRLEHPVQLGLLASFRRRLQFFGALLQASREEYRLLDRKRTRGLRIGAEFR